MLRRGGGLRLALLGALCAPGDCDYYYSNGLAPELTENCTFFHKRPYGKQLQNYAPDLVVLDRDFGLRCTPKPEGAMTSIGFVDSGKAWELLNTYGDDVWMQNDFRQRVFSVHKDTQSVLLLWKKHLLTDVLEFPMWKVWEPIFQPVLRAFAEKMGYDIEELSVWRAMLARLRPGAKITPHRDSGLPLAYPHRVHWVLETEPGKVKTTIGGEELDLPPDLVFEFNNVLKHSIVHAGEKWRIHAILDLVPKKTHPHRPVSATANIRDDL